MVLSRQRRFYSVTLNTVHSERMKHLEPYRSRYAEADDPLPSELPPSNSQKIVDIRRDAKAAEARARAAQAFNWQAAHKVKGAVKVIQSTIQWIELHQETLPDETSQAMDNL